MTILQAILLGIIQGLTEFIPISSTAHLTIAGRLMGLISKDQPEQWTAFIAVIQLGTLIAVIVYFLPDIIKIIGGFIAGNAALLTKKPLANDRLAACKLGWLIIIGTVPAGVAGVAFRQAIEGSLTKNLWVITSSMIGVAVLLTIAEMVASKERGLDRLKLADAIVVGLSQALALIPGSSRSGATITGGLFAGLTREAAARFSFLLSIPAIAASGLLELPKALKSVNTPVPDIIVATLASGIVGYASIFFLLRYLQRHTTFVFVGYRVLIGGALLYLLVSGRMTG